MKKRKLVCIIGLGHFGAGLAKSLARYCEVLALDSDIQRVNAVGDMVQRALCIDARDFQALSSVVSSDFDEAIVSIGEELEASILCTLHLKHIGIKTIRAKANNKDHADILKSLGASHIVFPEEETAERLASLIMNPNLLDFIPLSEDYRVMELTPPDFFLNQTILETKLRSQYGLFVIAIKKKNKNTFDFLPGPDHVIQNDDILVIIGREQSILSLLNKKNSD